MRQIAYFWCMKLNFLLVCTILIVSFGCKSGNHPGETGMVPMVDTEESVAEEANPSHAILISPESPMPGQSVRILLTGGKDIVKAKIEINGPSSGQVKKIREGQGLPFWRIDEFSPSASGLYRISILLKGQTVATTELSVFDKPVPMKSSGSIWKTERGWDSKDEALYSAWINALFSDAREGDSWPALHEVTGDPSMNFLYNHLGIGEDDPKEKIRVIMEPDCADNPFYFRAYFAWKMGLPFGYHEADRGWMGKAPSNGRWITNETPTSRNHPVLSFNAFLRRLMDGVHSGTARTAFANEQSDYYPVGLTRQALRPGVTFADPYGHTLILVRWIPQAGSRPGTLLSVDAQPDGTVAIKRFWKGNFLFATEEVIGEPGFKAFRPIVLSNGQLKLMSNKQLSEDSSRVPYSEQQRKMKPEEFYDTMDRCINPKPLDPETALLDLLDALHEQCLGRVMSVENGEKYMQSHPGEVIPMPGRPAGVFLAGGSWEDFSTPNRDLRLLIAMDAVLDFPDKVLRMPDAYRMPKLSSPAQVRENLISLIEKSSREREVTYTRTDGSKQTLTLAELLRRRDSFEMAYNPNDCAEIRWGAPANSEEISTCKRRVPASQAEKMRAVRPWFQKRLHPPT